MLYICVEGSVLTQELQYVGSLYFTKLLLPVKASAKQTVLDIELVLLSASLLHCVGRFVVCVYGECGKLKRYDTFNAIAVLVATITYRCFISLLLLSGLTPRVNLSVM